MERVKSWLVAARTGFGLLERPQVTLSYAQSLDGCLTLNRGKPFALNGRDSLVVTHMLRSQHDALLVGIGTVISNNPRLNVRYVEGKDPRPVILDSHLKIPLDSKLLARSENQPWIACGPTADEEKFGALEARNVRVIPCRLNEHRQVDLADLLFQLKASGVHSLMVEGGAGVITNFLAAQLVDLAVLTIAPVWLGGFRAVDHPMLESKLLQLAEVHSEWFGPDLIMWGHVLSRREG
jgi:diaminohydroxyphosphoribosylaminopyrimidine deaminase/5-amino-6-(5-phosphoribosylamino)uracil reductase